MEENMIKLKYSSLNSQEFRQALQELSKSKEFPNFQVAYNVAKIFRKYNNEFKTLNTLYFDLAKDCAEKDEKGEVIMEGPGWKINPAKKEIFQSKFNDLMNVEVEIEAHPVKVDDLQNVKLSPEQITALEPIISL